MLEILLSIVQLPRSTFYYHLKQMGKADKYESVKEDSSDVVSYTISDRPVLSMVTSMLNKVFALIPDNTNLILRIKAKLKGLPTAIHRLQALSAA